MGVTSLGPADLALGASLVALDALLSAALRLGMARAIVVAAARTVGQLLLVGYLLRFVFAHASPALTLSVVTVMIVMAVREVAARPDERLRGHGNVLVAALSVGAATAVTLLIVLGTALRPAPWFDPRSLISLVGIVLGSALNAGSLALDGMLGSVRREQSAIEARLALGATAADAFSGLLRASVRRAIVPSINQMSAAGIITLPGIMTGQILAGADPLDAVKTQILLLFLLAGSSGLAAVAAAHAAMRRLSDDRGRLRLDRLST